MTIDTRPMTFTPRFTIAPAITGAGNGGRIIIEHLMNPRPKSGRGYLLLSANCQPSTVNGFP